jgi:Sec-independent protein secretion pathway component TatC
MRLGMGCVGIWQPYSQSSEHQEQLVSQLSALCVLFHVQMPIWDHLEELRERVMVGLLAAGVAIGGCFCFSKELVLFLEAPVADAGVRFLQLSPGEFFFTTFKVGNQHDVLVAMAGSSNC